MVDCTPPTTEEKAAPLVHGAKILVYNPHFVWWCNLGFATTTCMRCVYKAGSALVACALLVSHHLQALCAFARNATDECTSVVLLPCC